MRSFRRAGALAGAASALPLIALPVIGLGSDVRVEELPELLPFSAALAVFAFLPFGLLIALAGRLSWAARWLGLVVSLGFQAAAYYPLIRPEADGQAGLVFLFLPFFLAVLVVLVWIIDLSVRAVAHRAFR